MNKKGADKLISVYWFVILTIVAGGIVLMVNSYYGSPYDVRELEANILATKVADCIYPGGKLNPALISEQGVFKPEFRDNFMKYCNLNFDTNSEFEPQQYYVQARFFESGEERLLKNTLEGGNPNYVADCTIKDGRDKLSFCLDREFWVKGPTEKIYLVKIKSIVAKVDQNAK